MDYLKIVYHINKLIYAGQIIVFNWFNVFAGCKTVIKALNLFTVDFAADTSRQINIYAFGNVT